jgi:hypothetical protein
VTADYYDARTEAGDGIEDPSEDALFELLMDLDQEVNTFVTVTTAQDGSRQAVISLREDGSYQVERHDTGPGWHEVRTETAAAAIARDLTVWLAG